MDKHDAPHLSPYDMRLMMGPNSKGTATIVMPAQVSGKEVGQHDAYSGVIRIVTQALRYFGRQELQDFESALRLPYMDHGGRGMGDAFAAAMTRIACDVTIPSHEIVVIIVSRITDDVLNNARTFLEKAPPNCMTVLVPLEGVADTVTTPEFLASHERFMIVPPSELSNTEIPRQLLDWRNSVRRSFAEPQPTDTPS